MPSLLEEDDGDDDGKKISIADFALVSSDKSNKAR